MWYFGNGSDDGCMKNNKENKKIMLIGFGIILIIILVGLVVMMIVRKNNNDKIDNLQNILNDSIQIEAVVNSDKSIELTSIENIDDNNKVEIWVFSEPIYLGEFNVQKEDDKYYLNGLNDILKGKDLSVGSHRLLIMQNDKSLGYINIEIDSDKLLKTTSSSIDLGNNTDNKNNSKVENSASNDNKQEEVKKTTTSATTKPKQEEVKCTPKKFKNKYTYVYEDKDTCVKNGDQIDAWNYFRANGIPATVYGCEEIVDECGNKYYGVYYGNTEGGRIYY